MNKTFIIIPFFLVLAGIVGCSQSDKDKPKTALPLSANAQTSPATNTNLILPNTTNSNLNDDKRVIFAKQAVSIFYNACALNAGDEQKVNDFARSQKMLELNAEQKATFKFEPEAKTVWGVKTLEGGQYYLVTGEHFCSLKARYADMNTVMQEFTKMSEQSAKIHGLTATVATDRDVNDKVLSHQKVYTMTKEKALSQYILTAQASDSNQIMAQAVLNFRMIPATVKLEKP